MTKLNLELIAILLIKILVISCADPQIKYKKVVYKADGSFSLEDELQNDMRTFRYLIAVKIKNNAYSLPTFLSTLENLKCPNYNQKCDLWIVFDKCTDNSYEIFTHWLSVTRPSFDTIIMINTDNDEQTSQKHPELSPTYFSKNLKLRAITYALDRKFDYILFLNADNILTNPDALEILIRKQKTFIVPLLTSSETRYSTFRVETEHYYNSIYDRIDIGCFKVKQAQETFLINLKDSKFSKFLDIEMNMLDDDDEHISHLAEHFKIPIYVCNRDIYGYIPDSIEDKKDAFLHLKIEHLLKGPNKTYNEPLKVSEHIDQSLFKATRKSKLGFDEIYIINLERRQDRRKRIEKALDELGVSYKTFKAVDGRVIDEEYLKSLGIKSVPNYKDPYNDRPLNYGEIGCFLSHYFIWKEMIEKNYKKVIILEDDARFVLNFRKILKNIMNSISDQKLNWDLIYLGRKIMKLKEETWNYDIPFYNQHGLIRPSYSHWTVAYALSLEGSRKLLALEPLKKMVPVDEYLPIMYDKQPNQYWSSFFPNRDLIAYAIQPSLIFPTHYTGEPSHISDTEHTKVINTDLFEADWSEANVHQENLLDLGLAHVEL